VLPVPEHRKKTLESESFLYRHKSLHTLQLHPERERERERERKKKKRVAISAPSLIIPTGSYGSLLAIRCGKQYAAIIS
jgi:hypothetical protein